uniref:Large Terminase n=1 Tax=Siphoviridae sp. ctUse40 TaxID=2826356 RepID=A0A8S5NEN8_9CAUD|nr:MAG TPA: Large Terminase [Siphoviridae sp. ctUse40]
MVENYKTRFPKDVQIYIDKIESCPSVVNNERLLLVEYLKDIFKNEELVYSEEQIAKYFSYEKYFPYGLFEWERFLFVLHYCVFRKDGLPRWSDLFIYMGRGGGKNYYLSWEDWCAITPTHGIKEYDIDICATSEEQAMTSFNEIYNILENNIKYKKVLEQNFHWTKTEIRNKKTNSTIKFRTNNAKSKDGLRSGALNFDEYHAYETYDNIRVFTTGLGKKENPRTTITTTDGEVRGGPLDKKKEQALDVLNRRTPDNGLLVFMCKLDDEKEVEDINMWQKANPSLEYRPSLLEQMKKEYVDYVQDPIGNSSFMTKRMNIPKMAMESQVTSWENILATGQITDENGNVITREVPDLSGMSCVAGIDFSSFDDFASACLTFKKDGTYYCIKHTWICSRSRDLPRIKPPLKDWERAGLLTFIDEPEISPYIITDWLQVQKQKYNIVKVGADHYRFIDIAKALKDIGFDVEDKERVKRVRPSDIMMTVNTISSAFNTHNVVWGDDPLMRWATWNAKLEPRQNNNYVYGKIEPKSRKTDPFMAFVHSMVLTLDIELEESNVVFMPIIKF